MGEIMDIYKLIRDLIEEAKNQKNLELVDALLEIKLKVNELEEENKELKEQINLKEKIVRHSDGVYITLEDDPQKIHYCAVCWGRNGKLIQMHDSGCIICDTNWQQAIKR